MTTSELIDLFGALGNWAAAGVAVWVAWLLQPRARVEERREAARRAEQERAEEEERERARFEGVARMMAREVANNRYAIASIQGRMGELLDRKNAVTPEVWEMRMTGLRLVSDAYDTHFGELSSMGAVLAPRFLVDEIQAHHHEIATALELMGGIQTALELFHDERDASILSYRVDDRSVQQLREKAQRALHNAVLHGAAFLKALGEAA